VSGSLEGSGEAVKIRTEVSNLENELVKSLRTLVQGLIPTDSTLCPHCVSTTIIKRRRQRTKVVSYSRSKLTGVPSWIEWLCGGGNYMHYNYNVSLCLSAFSFYIFPINVIMWLLQPHWLCPPSPFPLTSSNTPYWKKSLAYETTPSLCCHLSSFLTVKILWLQRSILQPSLEGQPHFFYEQRGKIHPDTMTSFLCHKRMQLLC